MPGWNSLDRQDRGNVRTVLCGLAFFLCLAAACVAAVFVEVASSRVKLGTEGLIELVQELLLLSCVLVFFCLALKKKDERGGDILVAGFLGSLYIRENDCVLDVLLVGGWQTAVAVFVAAVLLGAWRSGIRSILAGLAAFVRSRAFVLMAAGLMIVLVYSRLYGSGWFWTHFGIDKAVAQMRITKDLSEECTELLGYLLVFCSSLGYLLSFVSCSREKNRQETSGRQ